MTGSPFVSGGRCRTRTKDGLIRQRPQARRMPLGASARAGAPPRPPVPFVAAPATRRRARCAARASHPATLRPRDRAWPAGRRWPAAPPPALRCRPPHHANAKPRQGRWTATAGLRLFCPHRHPAPAPMSLPAQALQTRAAAPQKSSLAPAPTAANPRLPRVHRPTPTQPRRPTRAKLRALARGAWARSERGQRSAAS